MILHSIPSGAHNKYFTAHGKSLLIAQKFESSCKYIVTDLNLSISIKEKMIEFIDLIDENKKVVGLRKQTIGNILGTRGEKIIEHGLLTEGSVNLLTEAVRNRNWLAHESLLDTAYSFGEGSSFDQLLKSTTELAERMEIIVRAEYLLGSIYIEMSEKTTFYNPNQEDDYTKKVLSWIFDHENEIEKGYNVLLSTNWRDIFI